MKKTPLKRNTPLARGGTLKRESDKHKAKKEERVEGGKAMMKFFMEIWNTRPHYCQITNKYLGEEPNTCFFHHILPKGVEKYKPYALKDWNIILLCPSVHSAVEARLSDFPDLFELTEQLKKLHQEGLLE